MILPVSSTQILIEDLYETVDAGTDWPLGLAQLVLRYNLHQQVWSRRARNQKGAHIFKGCHNGGNKAITNLEVLFCSILDPTFGINYFDCNEEDFDIMANKTMAQLQTIDVTNLLLNPTANSTFLCFDFEGVDGTTSEYGWAWVHSNEICRKVPGEREKNWRQLIRAQHYLNAQDKGFYKLTTKPNSELNINAPNVKWRPEYTIWQTFHRETLLHLGVKLRHSIFVHVLDSVLYQMKKGQSRMNPHHLALIPTLVTALTNGGAIETQIAVLTP